MNLRGHGVLHLYGWYLDGARMVVKGARRAICVLDLRGCVCMPARMRRSRLGPPGLRFKPWRQIIERDSE
jgi:hypothetical protein